MTVNRRQFLQGLLATAAAASIPAVIEGDTLVLHPADIKLRKVITYDMALTIEDFARRYIEPAMRALVDKIDRDITDTLLGNV